MVSSMIDRSSLCFGVPSSLEFRGVTRLLRTNQIAGLVFLDVIVIVDVNVVNCLFVILSLHLLNA